MFTFQFHMPMRYARFFLLISILSIGFTAGAQNYFLFPENFYLQKGAQIKLHLVVSDDLTKQADSKFQLSKTQSFMLYEGKKKTDLLPLVKDTASVITCEPAEEGLSLITMAANSAPTEMSRSKFLRSVDENDPDKITEKVKASNQLYFKEKNINYMKVLVEVGKPGSNSFDKPLNNDMEIILQQNPYKGSYGDDITGLVLFGGKPLVNASVTLIVKTVGGGVFPQKLSSDAGGLVYFKLSREGIYILRAKHYEVSKDKTADYESWRATLTFGFSSANDLPNTYREFGFGNMH